jgi:hypothetical protein
MMAYLIFQCSSSANLRSTAPRLRSSCSSIKRSNLRIRALFVFAFISYITLVLVFISCPLVRLYNLYSACWLCTDVDTMAAAVTLILCITSRPSFPRNNSWMPIQTTAIDETYPQRTISPFRRITILSVRSDFIMKYVTSPSAC